jgi:hypothetical protein
MESWNNGVMRFGFPTLQHSITLALRGGVGHMGAMDRSMLECWKNGAAKIGVLE